MIEQGNREEEEGKRVDKSRGGEHVQVMRSSKGREEKMHSNRGKL